MRVHWLIGASLFLPLAVATSPSGAATPTAAGPRAQVTATAQERSDERVRVVVTTSGQRVVIRYRADGSRHSVTRTAKQQSVRALLPPNSRRISVRANATPRLAASRWVRVTVQPYPTTPGADPSNGSGEAPGATDPTPDPTDPSPESDTSTPSIFGEGSAAVTDAQLSAAARASVLFGHQSVGANILDGVSSLYDNRGLTAPRIMEWPGTTSGGYVTHVYVGENGNPRGKISHFAEAVRAAGPLQVALMKLCYVDIVADTNVDDVFDRYRTTMAALAQERPDITFLYTTVPLTVGASADNAARQRYNAKIRAEFGSTGRLFDVAAVESTRADGSRTTAGSGSYLTLNPDYASDGDGHLNGTGSRRAAAALFRTIATALG